MNTYIIFFGKSQDFTFYAFDNAGVITDFNSVIRNFDQLESNIFSVDDADNKEILAKYVFSTTKGKMYSLLKLYSCAQASNGSRISGSTYGVAILSEGDIQLSKFNVGLLQSAKSSFGKLVLSGIKFLKSDFKEEANRMWGGIINSENGNYLHQIEIKPVIPKTHKTEIAAFHVEKLLEGAIEVKDSQIQANRVYITTDLEHLKRVHEKWGEIKFPLYVKKEKGFEQNNQQMPGPGRLSSTDIKDIQSELVILRDDIMQLRRGYGKKLEQLNKTLSYALYSIVFISGFLVFWVVWDIYSSDSRDAEIVRRATSETKNIINKKDTTSKSDIDNSASIKTIQSDIDMLKEKVKKLE
ncbi:MAG: hypothetical protein ACO3B0_05845 [Chitinophagaceae bacterium]